MTEPSTEVKPDAARYRALYLLCVACFPVVLAGLLSLGVFASGAVAMDDGIGHTSDVASFDYPVPGVKVRERFTVKGKLHAVPSEKSVYLVETVNDRFWPKKLLGSSPMPFSREHFADAGAGYKYSIELIALDEDGLQQVEQWFKTGKSTGKYPGILKTPEFETVARVRVIRQ